MGIVPKATRSKGIISGYSDLIVFAAMQKARRAKYNECVLSPEKT